MKRLIEALRSGYEFAMECALVTFEWVAVLGVTGLALLAVVAVIGLAGCGESAEQQALWEQHQAKWRADGVVLRTHGPDQFGVVCYQAYDSSRLSCVKVQEPK